jgi:hypothetical protein
MDRPQRHGEQGTVKPGKKRERKLFEAGRAILRGRVYQKRRFDVKKYLGRIFTTARCPGMRLAQFLPALAFVL